MSSRQINLYLTEIDEAALIDYVRANSDLVFIENESYDEKPVTIDTIEDFNKSKIYLSTKNFVNEVILYKSERLGKSFVDGMKSPVIEYSRCRLNGSKLHRGRFFYETRYFENQNILSKGDDFKLWAAKIFAITKKSLTRLPDSYYYGTNAQQRVSNGSLSTLDI